MAEFKEYIATDKENVKIKITINYNKNASGWMSRIKDGYTLTAVPVEISKRENNITIETSTALTGFNDHLLQVERKSKSGLAKAIQIMNERRTNHLQFFKDKGINIK